jgi:hypothetical protein
MCTTSARACCTHSLGGRAGGAARARACQGTCRQLGRTFRADNVSLFAAKWDHARQGRLAARRSARRRFARTHPARRAYTEALRAAAQPSARHDDDDATAHGPPPSPPPPSSAAAAAALGAAAASGSPPPHTPPALAPAAAGTTSRGGPHRSSSRLSNAAAVAASSPPAAPPPPPPRSASAASQPSSALCCAAARAQRARGRSAHDGVCAGPARGGIGAARARATRPLRPPRACGGTLRSPHGAVRRLGTDLARARGVPPRRDAAAGAPAAARSQRTTSRRHAQRKAEQAARKKCTSDERGGKKRRRHFRRGVAPSRSRAPLCAVAHQRVQERPGRVLPHARHGGLRAARRGPAGACAATKSGVVTPRAARAQPLFFRVTTRSSPRRRCTRPPRCATAAWRDGGVARMAAADALRRRASAVLRMCQFLRGTKMRRGAEGVLKGFPLRPRDTSGTVDARRDAHGPLWLRRHARVSREGKPPAQTAQPDRHI